MVHLQLRLNLSKKTRLWIAIALSACFFVAEIALGFYTRSLALIADAFHVSFDLISFSIALLAIHVSEKNKSTRTKGLSFGWQRAQLLGSFFNGVFQLALGFSIILLSVERFIFLEHVDNPMLMLIVACAGLASNVIAGAFLGVHDHSHGDEPGDLDVDPLTAHQDLGHRHHTSGPRPTWWRKYVAHMNSEPSSTPDLEAEDSGKISASRPHGHHHHHDLGMKAVLIHVLGDALNNIGVIIAGVLIWKSNSSKRFYADPAMSLVIGVMLILTALNLVIRGGAILMLSEPVGVDMDDIKYDLERVSSQESALKLVTTNGEAIQIPGVQSVHELHAWRLNEEKSCATVHVIVDDPSDHAFQQIAKTIRQCLHAYGIHSATIQPEVPTSGLSSATDVGERRQSSSGCSVHCGHVCGEKRCCG